MTRILAALLCILTGIWLIAAALQRKPRKYILLSGRVDGKTWARRMKA